MRIVPIESVEPADRGGKVGIRGGGIIFKDLLAGVEGTPNNYGLQLVEVPSAYNAPRHRHNFEQVRLMIEGSFGYGPGVQEAGQCGYFCEGTYYKQEAEGRSMMLLLQAGGPTGNGFMSRRQNRGGIASLAEKGKLEKGIFTWFDADGRKHNQDGYEAVWEHVNQRKIGYPRPQYDGPVVFRLERFPWHAVAGAAGASVRSYGIFNDRGLGLSGIRLEPGARYEIPADDAREQLLFCLHGAGRVAGADPYATWTAIGLDRGEGATLEAGEGSEFFAIALPDYTPRADVDDRAVEAPEPLAEVA